MERGVWLGEHMEIDMEIDIDNGEWSCGSVGHEEYSVSGQVAALSTFNLWGMYNCATMIHAKVLASTKSLPIHAVQYSQRIKESEGRNLIICRGGHS